MQSTDPCPCVFETPMFRIGSYLSLCPPRKLQPAAVTA